MTIFLQGTSLRRNCERSVKTTGCCSLESRNQDESRTSGYSNERSEIFSMARPARPDSSSCFVLFKLQTLQTLRKYHTNTCTYIEIALAASRFLKDIYPKPLQQLGLTQCSLAHANAKEHFHTVCISSIPLLSGNLRDEKRWKKIEVKEAGTQSPRTKKEEKNCQPAKHE